jgi:23S rRNA G2445 N2-methylase RlmL
MIRVPPISKRFPVKRVIGFDLNAVLIKRVNDEQNLDLRVLDSVKAPLNMGEEFVMICNPPYGERIKIAGKRGIFLKEAWKKFIEIDQPKRFGWVLPSDMDDLFSKALGYRLLKKTHLKNGGLAVTFWLWERNTNP